MNDEKIQQKLEQKDKKILMLEKKVERLTSQVENLKKKNEALTLKNQKQKLDFMNYKKKLSQGEIVVDKKAKKSKSLWAQLIDDYPLICDAVNKMQKKFSWTYLNHKSAAEVIRKSLEGIPREKIPPEFAGEKQLRTYFNFLIYLPTNVWGKEIFGGAPVSLQAALKRRAQIKIAMKENPTIKAYWVKFLRETESS